VEAPEHYAAIKEPGKFRILVLCGPSAAGKTTLGRRLGLPELVSHTSRPPRPGEVDGVDYYFTSRSKLYGLYVLGDLVEYNIYGGHVYGLSEDEVAAKLEEHPVVFVVMERQGVLQLKQHPICGPMVRVAFITAPKPELERRMRARGDGEDDIRARLARYSEDLKGCYIADISVSNESLPRTVDLLRGAVANWLGE